MSKAALLEKLTNKEYRDAFISEEIDVGLPMQIREMRECRGWKQSEVAKKIDTQQPRFSVMEKPGYGNFSLNTLKKLAAAFDVGLIVSFVPYSEMIDFTESMSRKRLMIPSFCDEYSRLANRYTSRVVDTQPSPQLSLTLASTLHETSYSKINVSDTETRVMKEDTAAKIECVSPIEISSFFVIGNHPQGSTYAGR